MLSLSRHTRQHLDRCCRALQRLAQSQLLPSANRFVHKFTKKQIRFLQDAIMPDRIRTEAIWPSGLTPKFNTRLNKFTTQKFI